MANNKETLINIEVKNLKLKKIRRSRIIFNIISMLLGGYCLIDAIFFQSGFGKVAMFVIGIAAILYGCYRFYEINKIYKEIRL